MITYTLETWAEYYRDVQPLWPLHYAELCGDPARMPMSPHVAMYETLQASGMLQILCVRADGTLIGYIVYTIHPHGHYSTTLCAFEDAYFLHPAYRKGGIGIKMLKQSIVHLKERAVQRVFIHTKKSADLSKLLTHLGMTHTDEIFSQWIGD